MALPEMSEREARSENKENRNERKERPLTKVIIRRLPPSIKRDEFIQQVSPLPDYDYLYSVRGDASLGENAFSRVYINFCNTDDIYIFKEKFDNYVFIDGKGHEYPAVVEYAAFQKIPKKRKPRTDPKIGSIETDPAYLEFLESLKEQPDENVEKPEYSYQFSTNENKTDISTPLLDFLKQRKLDKQRIREEKREERKKREMERKKMREEERRKREERKLAIRNAKMSAKEGETSKADLPIIKEKEESDKGEEKQEVIKEKPAPEKFFKNNKDRKFDDRPKSFGKSRPPKYSRSDRFEERREYKSSRRDDYRDRDTRGPPRNKSDFKKIEAKEKKVKKYSERREERKSEARKAEQGKDDSSTSYANQESSQSQEDHVKITIKKKEPDVKLETKEQDDIRSPEKRDSREGDDLEYRQKNKENDPRMQRRIKNKDRPSLTLYKPGMLRKKSVDSDKDCNEAKETDTTKLEDK